MACRTILFGAALMPALSAAVIAQPKYDAKLEQAAMQVIAGKIGDIRPGFRYDQHPAFTVPQELPAPTAQDTIASWQIVDSEQEAQPGSMGSVQILPDNSTPKAEDQGAASSRTATRVINY